MIYYTSVDETGRINSTTPHKEYANPDSIKFDFADDFDFSKQNEYQIIKGKLVHNPLPPSEEELEFEREALRRSQMEIATSLFVQTSAAMLSDEQALSVSMLFDEWASGVKCTKGQIIRHDGSLYRIGQDHTSQDNWVPGSEGMTALYSEIKIDEGGYEEWKAWDGVSGIYAQDQIVRDPNDGKLYKSKIANNVWGPPSEQPTMWDPYSE